MVPRSVLTAGKTCENFKTGTFLKYLLESIGEEGRGRPTLEGTGIVEESVETGDAVEDKREVSLRLPPLGRRTESNCIVPVETIDCTPSQDTVRGAVEATSVNTSVEQLTWR